MENHSRYMDVVYVGCIAGYSIGKMPAGNGRSLVSGRQGMSNCTNLTGLVFPNLASSNTSHKI